VKANFENHFFHFIGSRVETTGGAFRALWVNCIQLVQPHLVLGVIAVVLVLVLVIAVQVENLKAKPLKPVSHFIGSRVETRRLQATGRLNQALSSYG
jgi:hypothetical protein